jgi:hypothetical protein
MDTGVIVTVDDDLPTSLNPAVAVTTKERFDVGIYWNPYGALIVNVEVPAPFVNGNQSELVFDPRFITGNVFVRIFGALIVI